MVEKEPDVMYVVSTDERDINYRYHLFLIGVMTNGEKAVTIVNGILPFFDVKIYDTECISFLINLLKPELHEITEKKEFKYYQHNTSKYLRCYYTSMIGRLSAMKKCGMTNYKSLPIITGSNDKTCYYRKVAREYKLKLASWIRIKAVTSSTSQYINSQIVSNIFNTTIANIESIERGVPPLVIAAWDIETHTDDVGKVPIPDSPCDPVFLISVVFYVYPNLDPVKKFVITLLPILKKTEFSNYNIDSEMNDVTYINVKMEHHLVIKFIEVLNRYSPDIVYGFNDVCYDWPYILQRLEWYDIPLQQLSVLRHIATPTVETKTDKVKVDTGMTIDREFLSVPGMLMFDIRISCRKVIISKYSSLKFYLTYYSLPQKLDMPVNEMREIYYENISQDISPDYTRLYTIYHYCLVDSMSCYRIAHATNLFFSLQENANLTYVNLFDAFYRANGVKVRNVMMAYGSDDFIFSTQSEEAEKVTEKYKGGHVLEPKTGLHNDRPTIVYDFVSLYPHLIITYNLSPDCLIINEADLAKVDLTRYSLLEVNFEYNNKTCKGWFVRYKDENDMGLYPKVLKKIFAERAKVKKELADNNDLLTYIEQTKDVPSIYSSYDDAVRNLELKNKILDAKQLSLKIIMNTAYGETGNANSPFYIVHVAAKITSMGQYNLQLSINYLKEVENCDVVYGDTDSAFIKLSQEYYDGVDKTKPIEDRWTQMLAITADASPQILSRLNEYIMDNNGFSYLRMENDGMYFPLILLEKKHYVAIKHDNPPFSLKVCNGELSSSEFAKSKSLVLKGLDIKKRGIDDYTKMIILEVLSELLSYRFDSTIEDVVVRKITELNTRIIDPKYFIRDRMYKLTKGSTFVDQFIDRLKKNNAPTIPTLGERFEYVVVNKPRENYKGCKCYYKISDKMELYDENTIYNFDKEYYNSMIYTILSKFIKPQLSADQDARKYLIKKLTSNTVSIKKKRYTSCIKPRLIDDSLLDATSVDDIISILSQTLPKYVPYKPVNLNEIFKLTNLSWNTFSMQYTNILNIRIAVYDKMFCDYCNTELCTNIILDIIETIRDKLTNDIIPLDIELDVINGIYEMVDLVSIMECKKHDTAILAQIKKNNTNNYRKTITTRLLSSHYKNISF
jgi:DNA polymerase elongation subunit (family B)